jgi:Subtilase family
VEELGRPHRLIDVPSKTQGVIAMPDPAPVKGKIPVLLVVGRQEPLVESASAIREGRPPTMDIRTATMPAGVQIDPTFNAVPVGQAIPGTLSMESVRPAASQKFVVRAFVDAQDGQIPTEVNGTKVFSQPRIEPILTCGGDPPLGNTGNVFTSLKCTALAAAGLTGKNVAIAIADTGINLPHLKTKLGAFPTFDAANSWNGPGATLAPGNYPVDHGSMCAYDVLIAAPSATLVDVPVLSNAGPGGSTMAGTLAAAVQAYAYLLAKWSVSFAPGDLGKYLGLVISNSWGVFDPSWDFPPGHPGRYIDNPNHPFNLLVGVLVTSGVDIVFAAGNCGAQCPDGRCAGTTATITGANAHGDVLTVAGCDTADQRVGYSSQGPSITGMPQQKPDVTAYTHFLGSEAFGAGTPDSGTSAACPVAAGCVAALRTKESHTSTPPRSLIAQIETTARQVAPNPAGWNADYGHGIIDPIALAQSLGHGGAVV